jgi:phosphopantetheinyl transferase
VHFNVSHSSGWAIYALGLGEVGVDLEFVRPIPEMQALVDQYLSVAERSGFGSVPDDQELKAFYNCWTRKEAYVKVLGGGLFIPLDQFDVSVDPNSPARLVRVRETLAMNCRGLFIALILQLKRSPRWFVRRTTSRAFAVSGPLDHAKLTSN